MVINRNRFTGSRADILFIAILLLVNIIFLREAMTLEFETALAPFVFTLPAIAFLTISTIITLRDKSKDSVDSAVKKRIEQRKTTGKKEGVLELVLSAGLAIICVISVALFGFFTTCFLFTSSIIFYYKSRRNILFDLSFSVGLGLAYSLFFWYLFVVMFETTRLMRIGWFI